MTMEVRDKIIHKAYELFKRYGIRSVTMDDLAHECGVSKKTLYQSFEDKDTLVDNIVGEMIGNSQQQCSMYKVKAENAIQEIFLSMDMLQEMFEGVNPAMMFDLRKYHDKSFARVDIHKREFLSNITRNNLERGIAEGLYRPDIKVDIITQFHLATITLAFEQVMFSSLKYSVLDVNLEIMTHYLYGIASSKGVKLIEKYKQQRQKPSTV
jgi:TetR/AcrR family transcriptional regulator, cholesterol catabolism regulator